MPTLAVGMPTTAQSLTDYKSVLLSDRLETCPTAGGGLFLTIRIMVKVARLGGMQNEERGILRVFANMVKNGKESRR
jgi:hypothetical protein